MKPVFFKLSALCAAALLGACANLAPVYDTPAAPVADAWPVQTQAGTAAATLGWQDVVSDTRLQQVIRLALDNNRDLRVAVLAIEQARTSYRVQAAAQLPTLDASAQGSATRTPAQASSSSVAVNTRSTSVSVGLSAWELDLFGRVQNLKDAALQSYFSTEQAQRSTRLSLVAEVATAWLTLAADQAQRALAQRTLDSQQASLALVQRRHALGADSALTLAQTQTSVLAAQRDVAAYEAQVQQDRNALGLLAGAAVPASLLPDGLPDTGATALVAVPAGLPSSVLQQRPDVLAAEHLLQAANANIGAARAALFPSIRLTASAGTASRSLADLFQGGAWSFVPTLTLPIFDGGAARAELRSAELARDVRLAGYDKAVQTAFREVADALAVRASLHARLQAQQGLVTATQRSLDLASARWRAGDVSHLEVLDAQRSLYAAQQSLINLQLAEQSNRVALLRVLGGGWRDSTLSS